MRFTYSIFLRAEFIPVSMTLLILKSSLNSHSLTYLVSMSVSVQKRAGKNRSGKSRQRKEKVPVTYSKNHFNVNRSVLNKG